MLLTCKLEELQSLNAVRDIRAPKCFDVLVFEGIMVFQDMVNAVFKILMAAEP